MPPLVLRWLIPVLVGLSLAGCEKKADTPNTTGSPSGGRSNEPTVELLFTYGSEKQAWVEAVTADFHAHPLKTSSGKRIHVTAVAKGSGDCIDELLDGTVKAHLTSPASAAFVKLGNARSRSKTGKDLLSKTDNLLLSPVVIAMWKPMAEALGWGQKPIGWSDIISLAREPQGWAARGNEQWGQFKFAHTHPQFSNSGLIALFAEVYAATGKVTNLTTADLAKPEVAKYLTDIERAVVHYGSSTGFFGRKMFTNGPQYLSAAVLYENMVIESYAQQGLSFPIVAVYPKEGTFWSDHPAGIVDREWVGPEEREAAQKYLDFLLERPQQEKAMQFGFRPALAEIPLGAPFDAAHGVNPKEPQTTLEVPGADVMDATLRLWQENKKRSNVTLVIDVSGSMDQNNRLRNARVGAQELIKLLGDSDNFRLLPFNNNVPPAAAAAPLKDSREKVTRSAGSLIAGGGTALYDAIATAYREQMTVSKGGTDKITAVIVLSDGADTDSKMKLEQLLELIRFDSERKAIRVFTIGYDAGPEAKILKQIADATQGKYYDGKPENIRDVFRDISTFF